MSTIYEAPVAEVKVGTRLICDDGFTCIDDGAVLEVKADENDELYFDCRGPAGSGAAVERHYLDGQLNSECTCYVGLKLFGQE